MTTPDTVRHALTHLTQQRQTLTNAIAALEAAYPPDDTEAHAAAVILPSVSYSAPPPPPHQAPPKPKAKPPTKRKTSGPTKAEKTAHFESVARQFTQPFHKDSYVAKAGGDPKAAEGAIYRMKARGFIISHGAGVYSLTPAQQTTSTPSAQEALLEAMRHKPQPQND